MEAFGIGGTLFLEVLFNMFGDVFGCVIVMIDVVWCVVETEIVDQYLLQFDSFANAVI